MLEDLFSLLVKLPSSKRSLRCYKLFRYTKRSPLSLANHGIATPSTPTTLGRSRTVKREAEAKGDSIQLVTALVLQLVQSCTGLPPADVPVAGRTFKVAIQSAHSYKAAQSSAWHVAKSFIRVSACVHLTVC
jgi:hypothetical protein